MPNTAETAAYVYKILYKATPYKGPVSNRFIAKGLFTPMKSSSMTIGFANSKLDE